MITTDRREQTAVIRLDRGVINAIDGELCRALDSVLCELEDDPAVGSAVLTSSSDPFFSIGFDLPALIELDEEGLGAFYRGFNTLCTRLLSWPKPIVAALPGHTIAGGCILALLCDYRLLASEKARMGLNEIRLGLPVPYLADRVLSELVGFRCAREITDTGSLFEPDACLSLGLADRLAPREEIRDEALAWALELAEAPGAAFGLMKKNRRSAVLEQFAKVRLVKEQAFLRLWFTPDTQDRLRAALHTFRR